MICRRQLRDVSYWPLEYSNIFNIKSELKTLDGALHPPPNALRKIHLNKYGRKNVFSRVEELI